MPFITYREMDTESGELRYYILQRQFPHNVGIIRTQPNAQSVAQSVVPGYNLWIDFFGTLRGNFLAVYPSFKEELQGTFDMMATWYFTERISNNEKRYEKFKVR